MSTSNRQSARLKAKQARKIPLKKVKRKATSTNSPKLCSTPIKNIESPKNIYEHTSVEKVKSIFRANKTNDFLRVCNSYCTRDNYLNMYDPDFIDDNSENSDEQSDNNNNSSSSSSSSHESDDPKNHETETARLDKQCQNLAVKRRRTLSSSDGSSNENKNEIEEDDSLLMMTSNNKVQNNSLNKNNGLVINAAGSSINKNRDSNSEGSDEIITSPLKLRTSILSSSDESESHLATKFHTKQRQKSSRALFVQEKKQQERKNKFASFHSKRQDIPNLSKTKEDTKNLINFTNKESNKTLTEQEIEDSLVDLSHEDIFGDDFPFANSDEECHILNVLENSKNKYSANLIENNNHHHHHHNHNHNHNNNNNNKESNKTLTDHEIEDSLVDFSREDIFGNEYPFANAIDESQILINNNNNNNNTLTPFKL